MATVTWLPPGKQTFVDINGQPVVGGKLYHYVPSTSMFKDTWQDAEGDILNTNPVILNARGQAIIYGDGLYRQRFVDADDNEIWDQVVGFTDLFPMTLDGELADPEDYGLVRWTFLESISPYQYFPTAGYQVALNTAPAGDFSTERVVEQYGWNNPDVTTGGFFPNGGQPYGDDGFRYYFGDNRTVISSTNNLRGGRPNVTNVTYNGGGGVTGMDIATTPYDGYNPSSPPTVTAYDNSGTGSGFAGFAGVNLDGTLTGALAVGFTPGANYTAAETAFIVEPPPGTQVLDVGPNFELHRDAAMDPASALGWVFYAGRTATSLVPNAYYGSQGVEVVSNDDSEPRGRLVACTADSFTVNAGNTPRAYTGLGFWVGIFRTDEPTMLLTDPGVGRINAAGYSINNGDLFGTPHIWDATQTFRSSDAGPNFGPDIVMTRQSASPANSDGGPRFNLQGYNDALATITYSSLSCTFLNVGAGAEAARFNIAGYVAGVNADRLYLGAGLFMAGATGGDKGAGTGNFTGVYDDGVLLSCYVFDAFLDGDIDMAKWDALVLNRVTPETPVRKVRRLQKVTKTETVVEVIDGVAIERTVTREAEEPVFETHPVFDEAGKPVMEVQFTPNRVQKPIVSKRQDGFHMVNGKMEPRIVTSSRMTWITEHVREVRQKVVRVPVYDEVPGAPESVEERIHHDARKFASRIGTEYDPLTLEGYIRHFKEKRHLTSMPNEEKFDPQDGMAVGSWTQRLIETVEIQAVLLSIVQDRLLALEAKG